jgi:tRNA A-37 threonylcarbamoyl transferase component Bud32
MRPLIGNEYERLCEAGGVTYLRSDRRALLQENGIVGFSDFLSHPPGETVSSHRTRNVTRVDLKDKTGARTVFLKRFGPMHLKDALKDMLLLRRVRTKALVEFEMLNAFRDAGLAVPVPIACGERHVLSRDRSSFLMTERLREGKPLDEALVELKDAARRRRLIAGLAGFVRGMHDAGFTHADLFARHLFVTEASDGSWSVAVIDLQRAGHGSSVSPARRGRDLAAFMLSLPPDAASARERRDFLLKYLDKTRLDKGELDFVRRKVLRRARRLSQRKPFLAWRPLLCRPAGREEHRRT